MSPTLEAVIEFMAHCMPGFPLGLLECDDRDRWTFVQEPGRIVQAELSWEGDKLVISTPGLVGDIWPEVVDPLRAWVQEGGFPPAIYRDEGPVVHWVLLGAEDAPLEDPVYQSKSDAEEELDHWRDQQHGGFPWGWEWCWLPDASISIEHLREAGFIVAMYRSDGGTSYRVAGLARGGYNFNSTHFAALYRLVNGEVQCAS